MVWDGIDDGSVDPQKLKSITRVFDCPPLTKDMRTFLDWVATYTVSPPGLVARMALRAPAAFDPEPMIEGLRLTDARPERMTSARERVIAMAENGLTWTRPGLAHAAGTSSSVIDGLTAQGVFETVFMPPPPVVAVPDPDYVEHRLEGPQKKAALDLLASVDAGGFSVSLIDGITGSGKTEVYFEAIAANLEGRQAGADPSAGNCADGEFSGALSGQVRLKAGRMAFGSGTAHPRKSLAAGNGRGRAGCGRRALGAVPAVREISG